MKRRESIRARIALGTAICFASLAVLAPGGAAAGDATNCLPAWIPAWIGSWSGDGCR